LKLRHVANPLRFLCVWGFFSKLLAGGDGFLPPNWFRTRSGHPFTRRSNPPPSSLHHGFPGILISLPHFSFADLLSQLYPVLSPSFPDVAVFDSGPFAGFDSWAGLMIVVYPLVHCSFCLYFVGGFFSPLLAFPKLRPFGLRLLSAGFGDEFFSRLFVTPLVLRTWLNICDSEPAFRCVPVWTLLLLLLA